MSTHARTQPAPDFVEARRAMTSVLASAERRCLTWLAGRLPSWITPDHLTALALAAMLTAGLSYWAAQFSRYWLAGVVVSLALNWFGDSLDGTLARVRRQERPRYGFYIDHVVDCAGVLFLLSGLASSGFMSPFIAMALLIAYFMLSIEIYLATYCLAVFRLSFWGLGPTELRVLLAIGTLALLSDPTVEVFGRSVRLFDVGGSIAVAIIGATFVVSVVRNARALHQAERLPRQARKSDERRDPPTRRASRRWLIFNLVGTMGMALQLVSAWALTTVAGIHYLVAIALSVEIAIVHNFLWHVRWTWSDRLAPAEGTIRRFLQFNATTGIVSIAGNVAVTAVLVRCVGLNPVVANAAAIGLCSTSNFLFINSRVFASAVGIIGVAMTAAANVEAATLVPEAAAAFDRYVRATESRLDEERDGRQPFLWLDGLPAAQQVEVHGRLRSDDVVVVRLQPRGGAFPGAMSHHWVGTTLVAGARIDEVVNVMQGYDDYQRIYRPAVRRSRLIARAGNRFEISLQLFIKKLVTVVLNTQSSVVYTPIGRTRMQVRSESTRIAEVGNPGAIVEHEEPVGRDSGFLWRFNNYCALDQRDEGTLVQCESLSLTRDTPFGLGWLIDPFVSSIPRESLEFTLRSLRAAVRPWRVAQPS